MPPDGYHSVSVPEEVIEQLALVMAEYDCDSWAEAIRLSGQIETPSVFLPVKISPDREPPVATVREVERADPPVPALGQ